MRILVAVCAAALLWCGSALGWTGNCGIWAQKRNAFTASNFAGTQAGFDAAKAAVGTNGSIFIYGGCEGLLTIGTLQDSVFVYAYDSAKWTVYGKAGSFRDRSGQARLDIDSLGIAVTGKVAVSDTIRSNVALRTSGWVSTPRLGPASSAGIGGAIRTVDGVTFALTGAGIQAAIDDCPSTGVVVLPGVDFTISTTITVTKPLRLVGSVMGGTNLTAAAGLSGPVIRVGSAGTGTNSVYLSDLHIDGNSQTTNAGGLLEIFRGDRCVMERVRVQLGKTTNLYLAGSAVSVRDCHFYGGGPSGTRTVDNIVVDANTSTSIENCFINDAGTGYAIKIRFTNADLTGTPPVTDRANQRVVIRNNHIEHNEKGILVDESDNVVIADNLFQPDDLSPETVYIDFTNRVRRSGITGNMFQLGASDQITRAGTSATDKRLVRFGTKTSDNWMWGNSIYHNASDLDTSPANDSIAYKEQYLDLGRNYVFNTEDAVIRSFDGDAGGHTVAGWQKSSSTNLLAAGSTEDLTVASWVATNIVSRTNVTTAGNPWQPVGTGNATQIVFNTATGASPNVTPAKITQQVTGLTFVSGDRVTFSVYANQNGYSQGDAVDYRLRIRDDQGTAVLAEMAFRARDKWIRPAVSFVAAAAYDTLNVDIIRYNRTGTQTGYFWGAMLSKGDLSPYTPTTAPAGFTALHGKFIHGIETPDSARWNSGFYAGGRFIPKLDGASATLNFGVPAAVPGSLDLTISVPGAAFGNRVAVGAPITIGANYILTGFVSAAGTVTIRWTQIAGAAADPDGAGGTYTADVIQ